MWFKEYLSCFKSSLFIAVQICLSLFLINTNIGYIVWETEKNSSIRDTDKDTYLFQYAMAAGGLFDEDGDYQGTCEKIKELRGINDIGEIFDVDVMVDEKFETNQDEWFQINVMDSVATSAVTYKMKEGRWLREKDKSGDVIHAVLGGAIAKRHKIGDKIYIEPDSREKYEIEVVGILPEYCNVFNMHVLMAGHGMDSFMKLCENDIFVNHAEIFDIIKKSGRGYSNAHCIVKLDKDADKGYLSDYGKIVSFEEMRQESEEQLNNFVKETLEDSIIWAVVIIFGIIATSYLVEKKRRYIWGIYLMLGEKPKFLLKIHMVNNIITYIVGVVLSFIIYEIYPKDMFSISGISIYHIIFDVVFILLMIVVSFMSSMYILRIEPREILTQVKE